MTIGIGATFKHSWSISQSQLDEFAHLSGDRNLLHTDGDYAKSHGFKDKVVHGALILAKVSEFIGMKLPYKDVVWLYSNIIFSNPLYLGEEAELSGSLTSYSSAVSTVELSIRVISGELQVCSGKIGLKVLR